MLIILRYSLVLLLNNIIQRKLLILIVICLGFSFAQAYTIRGRVLDSKTEKPLKNVNIYLKNTIIGTTTDKDGYFLIDINNQWGDSVELTFKMIGFGEQSHHIELSESEIDIGIILLKVESLLLESVHIHSHQHPAKQISDLSLGGQKLSENLVGNIATTLSNQPNIGVGSFGTVTSKPVLRGYSGDRFLLTKDGSKTGDLSQSSIDHVITLDMTEVSEIEIVRGPRALVYGSNAIGGAINTKIIGNPRVKVDKLYKKILVGGESFNKGFYSNLMVYVPIKTSQVNILLNKRTTGNQTSPIGELDNTGSETYNYKLGITKYNEHNYINASVESFIMDYGIPPSEEGHINGVDIELFKNTFQFNYHQDISLYNFNQLDVKYNFIDYEHQEYENGLDYYQVALAKNTHDIQLEIESANSILGSEFNYKQFLPRGFYWTPATDVLNLSFYGFHEKGFDSYDILSSFRVGHLSTYPEQKNWSYANLDNQEVKKRNFNYFSSSIGIKKYLDKFEMNSWFMNTMKAPRVEELYSDGPHLGSYSYEIGEPNLELEKIYGIESSIRYNAESLDISLTTFYNYSPYYYQMNKMGNCSDEFVIGESHPCAGADYIEWGSGTSGWLYKYQAKGVRSLIKGLEFNVSYDYQDFKIVYDFSLVRGDDLSNGRPLSYINPDKHIAIFEYQREITNYKLRLSKIHSQTRLGEFETYTPSSFLVDFIFGYKKRNQSFTVQFNNIFNEEHYNHLSKIKSIMPEAGRYVVISYNLFY